VRQRSQHLWIYASNDSYFGPDIAAFLVSAWNHYGGRAEFQLLTANGSEGHDVVADAAGWDLWGRKLEGLLSEVIKSQRLHTVRE
jgi:hypothetical protein